MRARKESWTALWVQWVLATIAGFAAVTAVNWGVIFLILPPPLPPSQTYYVAILSWLLTGWAVTGAVVGTMQWLVLSRRVQQAGRWVLASLVGFMYLTLGSWSSYTLFFFPGVYTGPPPLEALLLAIGHGGLAGAMVGATQWLFLERHVSRSGWWVVANVLGLAAFMIVDWGTSPAAESAFGQAWGVFVVRGLWGASVFGAITGGALVWLMRRTSGEPESEERTGH